MCIGEVPHFAVTGVGLKRCEQRTTAIRSGLALEECDELEESIL